MSTANYFATSYFAPSYFAPSYFPAPLAGAVVGYRDRDAFAALAAALDGTSEFAAVVMADPLGPEAVAADRTPLAVLAPVSWVEVADAVPTAAIRRVAYTLTIVARGAYPDDSFQQLDRLAAIVQNAIIGSDLGGGCLGGLTTLRQGRFDPAVRYPERRLILSGEFGYPIPTLNGRDTSP
jgi:hypothetical protein